MLVDKELVEEETKLVVLNDRFSADDEQLAGDRMLQKTFGVTADKCNALTTKLYIIVLDLLHKIATECANLMLSPAQMQCLWMPGHKSLRCRC
jgi:hypothetical protein